MKTKPTALPAPALQHKALNRIAVAADADARSVKKYLAGGELRPYLAERIKAALAAAGLPPQELA